ncbi:MAG: UDP-3-O-(3-hydroxymyristoyl)glucosamine N-acyltransferase [Magnetococcales bacterium]|nr:UDP-3-O-(3-hydroxymyristoyl)glucosamine N-acyltransferase [Magnetococcales bacterium]MBF0149681.1 UDP-3-O-(3-hydroxymyristoyl)glucosamine N-acyltransferase [Magnetococcales bacterium]MBF0173979.1 UDP-3-O-(3-hydroxymyristoyl)glucosamine N-acyltransferase [Magnetococcales bacterium]MBF0346647.1 UDP-3-O-(3-hydroxymyristoyl)glucosamine N-acyltransferase [Magnetococcales bacterium]MBF0630731.1 UDP-3-O-(3-hydroxymyristoyl)glucosamine N-acyltransferase [Magnetococcales bacterium]
MKLSELAQTLKLEHVGADVDVKRVVPLEQATIDDLSFVIDAHWLEKAPATTALIVQKKLLSRVQDRPCLLSDHPPLDAAQAAIHLGMLPFGLAPGIHPQALIHPGARLGTGVGVGPGAHIGDQVTIGDDSLIHAGAVILPGTIIGARCIIQSNAVIGADGFGYEFVQGRHVKIPHFGNVILGDDVEVGACTTIDRGRFGPTRIGDGTKIDNQVQIAHNCQIGKGCIIVAQVGISGSCILEDYCVLAGQAGVVPHITIGKGARIAAGTGVAEDVPAGATWSGWWGQNHRDNRIQIVLLRKLPELMKKMRSLLEKGDQNTD